MMNRLTQLKTFLLDHYGYCLTRLDYKEIGQIKNILTHELFFCEQNEPLRSNDQSKTDQRINTYDVFNLNYLYPNHKDKVSEETYKEWMQHAHTLLQTCEASLFNQLLLQFSLLVESNGRVQHAFQRYGCRDEKFKQMISEKSLKHVELYSSHELIELFHNFVRLSLKPTETWRNTWCGLSLKQMSVYNIYDFESIFHYFHSLGIYLTDEWIKAFFDHTYDLLNNAKLPDLYELAHCSAYHRLDLPEDWAQTLSQRLLSLLDDAQNECIFSLPVILSIKTLPNRDLLLSKWFDKIISIMKETKPTLLIDTLYQLAKFDIAATDQWLIRLQKRLLEAFHLLDRKDIIILLFSLAIMENKIERIEPILDACQNYFLKRENNLILTKGTLSEIQRLLLAINTFDLLGYKITLTIQDEHNLYESFFTEKSSTNTVKNDLKYYLTTTYFSDLVQHVRVSLLLRYVDFISSDNDLIIVVDRNKKSQVKTRLMNKLVESTGYSILHLSYEEVKIKGYKYVDEIIQHHLKNKKMLNDKKDIFVKPQFSSFEPNQDPEKQLKLASNNLHISATSENSNTEKKPLNFPMNSRGKKSKNGKVKNKNQDQRKLNRNVLSRVLDI